jgi:hypothetical protein
MAYPPFGRDMGSYPSVKARLRPISILFTTTTGKAIVQQEKQEKKNKIALSHLTQERYN